MTGGMCWEAMGNIGACPGRPVIVVLNDNGRSYGPTVGSLGGHLGMLRLAAASVRPIRPAGGDPVKTPGVGLLRAGAGHGGAGAGRGGGAGGLAMAGLHRVVAVYATFLNRAFDQVVMDGALHRLPVTFVLDRAGVTGPDGPSHHGMWDACWLPLVPGLRLAAPRDPAQLRALLREAVDITTGPAVIRYPKATAGPDIPAVRRIRGVDVLREDPRAAVLLVAVGATPPARLAAAGPPGRPRPPPPPAPPGAARRRGGAPPLPASGGGPGPGRGGRAGQPAVDAHHPRRRRGRPLAADRGAGRGRQQDRPGRGALPRRRRGA